MHVILAFPCSLSIIFFSYPGCSPGKMQVLWYVYRSSHCDLVIYIIWYLLVHPKNPVREDVEHMF